MAENPYGSVADVSGIFGAPQKLEAPEGAGYATGAGKGLIAFDQFLKGIRAGHAQMAMQKYGQAENQLRISKDTYDALAKQLDIEKASPTPDVQRIAQLTEASRQALENYTSSASELQNFFAQKGGKGKGGDGQKQNVGEKIGEYLKNFITGGEINTGGALPPMTTKAPGTSPVAPPQVGMSTPPFIGLPYTGV